ncbi:MAG TPA: phenylalanine--tRNA ligase subunit alpha [Candidatus Moranbacteria bacterium]|nr:phenylalanine--tRNA ligase subunit alpha [Candidatus Moranbacteria bacterium]
MTNISGKIKELVKTAKKEVAVGDLERLEKLRVKFLGRKSELTKILKSLKDLSVEEKKKIGPVANEARIKINELIETKKEELLAEIDRQKNWIDVTAPGKKKYLGKLNLISQVQREIEEIFTKMGFEIADGPEIEDEWHNFSALNVPKDHPARDMQDTFWLESGNSQDEAEHNERKTFLPRTHTSNAQIRYMETHQPPFKIIVPGRCFRNEASDSTHEHTFHQFEALVVGDDISVANFKDIAQKFFAKFFGIEDLKVRLRPSYFPFTEPSFEFDISCTVCGGDGCKACKGGGWLEIGGAGMVNQRVFEASGYSKDKYQGFAWGFGLERLAMMKYQVDDIRLFADGDLRFVRQF